MMCAIILHNMIIEDEGRAICRFDENANQDDDEDEEEISEEQFNANVQEVRNRDTHHRLRTDLIEHISRLPRNNN